MAVKNIREKKEELGECIKKIGLTAVKAAPEDWERIVLGFFDFGQERSEISVFHVYRTSEGEYINWGETAFEQDDEELEDLLCDLTDYFIELHKICVKAYDDWRMAVMTIEKSGSFDMKYSYEPVIKYDRRYIQEWEAEYLR